MASNYIRGRRLEYHVRDMFREQGFFVIRCAGSKPVDLVVFYDGKPFFVEVKDHPNISLKEKIKLSKIAEDTMVSTAIIYRDRRGCLRVMFVNEEEERFTKLFEEVIKWG